MKYMKPMRVDEVMRRLCARGNIQSVISSKWNQISLGRLLIVLMLSSPPSPPHPSSLPL